MRSVLFIKPHVPIHANQNLELPLGLMMLSAHLKRELGEAVSVTILDLRVEKERDRLLADTLRRERPDLIGLSLMNFERPFLERQLAGIRAAAPGALIVAGGAYPSCNTEEALSRFPEIDLVVRGEGEDTLVDLIRRHAAGEHLHDVPGTAFRRDGRVVIAPDRPLIEPLDRLPMPDYAAVDLDRYLGPHTPMNVILAERRYVILMTSRSCPYRCAFCHDIMGKGFRPHSAARVLDEMAFLHDRHGIREFHIVDDVFNLDRDRMHAICNGIIERGWKIRIAFPNAIRGDILTAADIDLLRAAGVYNITFSIETASPRLQEKIEKRLDIGRTLDNIRHAHSLGIVTKAYFMLGFPGETREEIERTLELALDPALDMISLFKVAPFRHTRLAAMAKEEWGAAAESDQSDYFTGRTLYERMTGVPLNRLIVTTYFRFYFPWRIVRTLRRLPRRRQFFARLFNNAALVFHAGRDRAGAKKSP